MPCNIMRDANGRPFGIVCSRGPARRRCAFCGAWSTKLCDWPAGPGKTCDRPLCDKHAVNVGPNRDWCPNHPKAIKEP